MEGSGSGVQGSEFPNENEIVDPDRNSPSANTRDDVVVNIAPSLEQSVYVPTQSDPESEVASTNSDYAWDMCPKAPPSSPSHLCLLVSPKAQVHLVLKLQELETTANSVSTLQTTAPATDDQTDVVTKKAKRKKGRRAAKSCGNFENLLPLLKSSDYDITQTPNPVESLQERGTIELQETVGPVLETSSNARTAGTSSEHIKEEVLDESYSEPSGTQERTDASVNIKLEPLDIQNVETPSIVNLPEDPVPFVALREESGAEFLIPKSEPNTEGVAGTVKCVVCDEAAPQEIRYAVYCCDPCFAFFEKNNCMIEPYTHLSTGCGNVFIPFFLKECIKAGMQPPQVPNTYIRARREGVKTGSCQVCGIGTDEMKRCGLQSCSRCSNLFMLFSTKLQELRCVHAVDRFGRRCGRCRLLRCLKLGMKTDFNGSSSATDVSEVVQCVVCWQIAPQQPVFGVTCCYQCESFFRRNHNKLKEIECSGHLVSDPPCDKCLVTLCLQAGMKYDGTEPRTVARTEHTPPHETQELRNWLSNMSLLDILVYTSKGVSIVDNSRSMILMAHFFNRLDSPKQELFSRTLTEMGKQQDVNLLEMIRCPNGKMLASEADLQTNLLVIPDKIFQLSDLALFNEVRNKARWRVLKQGTLADYIDPILQSEYKRGDVEWWIHEPFEKVYLKNLQDTFQTPGDDSRTTEMKKRPSSLVAEIKPKRRNLTMESSGYVTVIDQVANEDEPLHEDRNGNVKHSEVDSVPDLPKRDLLANGSSTEEVELVLPSETCVIPDRFVSNEDRDLFLRKRDKIRMLVLAANLLEKHRDQCLQTEIDSGTYQEYWFLADGYIDEYFKMLDRRNGGVQNRQTQVPAVFPGSSRGLAEEKASRRSTESPVQVADCGVPHMTEKMLVGSESIGERPIEGPTEEPSPAPSPVCTDLIIDDESGQEGEAFEMDSDTYYGNSFAGDEDY